jgi:hypothetical protein
MKKLILMSMVLGLLTGVSVAQRGRPAGAAVSPTARPSGVSPTARPDVDLSARRAAGVSPSTTVNRGVSATAAPIKDPTVAPRSATMNRNVDPTAAPIRDPLAGASATAGANTVNRGVSPTAAAPIRDPK